VFGDGDIYDCGALGGGFGSGSSGSGMLMVVVVVLVMVMVPMVVLMRGCRVQCFGGCH